MRRIQTESCREIEEFMRTNRSAFSKLANFGSQYDDQENFQLLPGHKEIIKGIPEQIKALDQSIMEKKQSKKPVDKPQRLPVADEALKGQLIFNLINYFAKNGFNLPENLITDLNLTDFQRHTNGLDVSCRFACPFCVKIFPVTFKEYWRSGNITSHLKGHVDSEKKRESQNSG